MIQVASPSLTIILAVSKRRRPFLPNRSFVITVRLLNRRARLIKTDFYPVSANFNGYSGMSTDEQKRRCGLILDRVRIPADLCVPRSVIFEPCIP
jgi:hypothetical protein